MARKTVIIQGDVTGDIGGVIISGNSGPVHVGDGDIHIGTDDERDGGDGGRHFHGTGVTVIEGDNHGGIGRRF